MNTEGKHDPWLSPWFSYELTRTDWPWIFEKGDKPSLIIATLEALAVLISLKIFFGDEPKQGRTKVQVVPTRTDNRGNESTLDKLMSTEFPSSAKIMKLSYCLKRMSTKASVKGPSAPRIAKPIHWQMVLPTASTLRGEMRWTSGDPPGRTSDGSADGSGHEGHACNRDIHKSREEATETEARGQDEGEGSVVRPT